MNLTKHIDTDRVKHSIAVAEKASELANVYNLDEEVCRVAGLLHDIGKNAIMPEGEDRVLYHCIAGVEIAKKDFNIDDKRILDAILYHTTGHKDMDDFAKIVFIADKTEKYRTYSDVEYLRNLTGQPIDYIVKEIIKSSQRHHDVLHPWTIELLNKWGISE